MYKIVIYLLVGALVGSAVTYGLMDGASESQQLASPEYKIDYIPEISVAEAEAQREDRYQSIKTIEDTLALPTDFAETEALYVIAGRADVFGVEELIQQATRIGDRSDRRAALNILLTRMTELDPYAALAVARDPALGVSESYERTVWVTWGRLDFEAALYAAGEGTFAQKKGAAQSLYASIRNYDAEKMALIKSALGVNPGRSTKAQRIYALADDSPAAAIRFIESRGSTAEQQEEIGWLAYYLSRSKQSSETIYADLIQSRANRLVFEQSMASHDAQSNPEAALEKLLADPANNQLRAQAYGALQNLAQQDPDKAFAFLEKIPDKSVSKNLGMMVVSAIAVHDPQRALAWARANTTLSEQSSIIASIVGQIAQTDPQLALSEAQSIQDNNARAQAISMVVMFSLQSNPAGAQGMLDLIDDVDHRRAIVNQLGQQWGQTDFDAAVQWVSSLSPDDQKYALQGMTQRLVHSDVDRAIALLQQFPAGGSRNLRVQIANNLASNRSVDAAQSFIDQYKGTPEYSQLQVSVLSVTAQSDPDRAMRMAETVQDERQRDQLYGSIVARKAVDDPRLALQWIDAISNSAYRQQATAQVAMIWNQKDPEEADRWLQSLPRGVTRDDAIVALTSSRGRPASESQQLIDTIGDASKKKQATLMFVRRLISTDAAEAERILSSLELSDTEELQFQQMLDNANYYGRSID